MVADESSAELLLPLTTPFDEKGDVDSEGLAANAQRYVRAGVDGFLVAGSTGEAASLTDDERVGLVAMLRRVVPDGVRLVAGTARESTRATVELSRRCVAAGADEILVLTPFYFRRRMSAEALSRHFTEVASSAGAPLLLYSMPAVTSLPIVPELAARLGREPGIAGLKDSSGDLPALEAVVRQADPSFRVYTGHGSLFADAVSAGARGGILAAGCILPEVYVRLRELLRAGRVEEARALQRELAPFVEEVVGELGVAGVKGALELRGLSGGEPRPPLLRATTEELARVERALRGLAERGIVDRIPLAD